VRDTPATIATLQELEAEGFYARTYQRALAPDLEQAAQ